MKRGTLESYQEGECSTKYGFSAVTQGQRLMLGRRVTEHLQEQVLVGRHLAGRLRMDASAGAGVGDAEMLYGNPRATPPGIRALMTDAKPFSPTRLLFTTRRTLLSRVCAVTVGVSQ
jgi:hypothetical protein